MIKSACKWSHSIYLGELSKMRILHVQWPPRGAVSRVQADDPPLKGQVPIYALYMGQYIGVGAYG